MRESKESVEMPARRLTTDEYFRTPESVLPQELIYGVLRAADAPTPQHQSILLDLTVALHAHVKARGLGRVWVAPVDVVLDAARALVVQPDLVYLSETRLLEVSDRIHVSPDMVLEVLSPNPRIGHLDERLRWFAQYGVRECWLVHQVERRLEIVAFERRQVSSRTVFLGTSPLRSAVLPQFEGPLDALVEW